MKIDETNSLESKAKNLALDWWRNDVCSPDVYGNDRSEELDLEDAYAEGIICGWGEAANATFEWLQKQKELVGISFEKDFYERYKQFMKDGKL